MMTIKSNIFSPQRCHPVILSLLVGMAVWGTGFDQLMANEKELTLLEKQRNNNAVRVIYQNQVPHTNRQGKMLTTYDPKESFLQIGMWGVPLSGKAYGHEYDWKELKDAGFNTVWPYHTKPEVALKEAEKYDVQVIHMIDPADHTDLEKIERTFGPIKDHPNQMGIVWADEPIGHLVPGFDMDAYFNKFLKWKEEANRVAPNIPVFINDAPWIMPPATTWWVKWNTAGDISCHDNYPNIVRSHQIRSISADPNGITQSVALATASNQEEKPIWFIVGAYSQTTNLDYPGRLCTAAQLRAQVYTAIINGATGINYFIWDSYLSRNAGCVGISPNPQIRYVHNAGEPGVPEETVVATPMQLIASKELWMAAEQTNKELLALTPSILSPTVKDTDYKVEITGESVTEAPIQCLLKPHPDGGFVLLTVNTDDAVLNVKYLFPEKIGQVTREFENQPPLEVKDEKSFSVRYEPFDTHVLRIK